MQGSIYFPKVQRHYTVRSYKAAVDKVEDDRLI